MTTENAQLIVAILTHNAGSILLTGTLLFIQTTYLPAIVDMRGAALRLRLRLDILQRSFRIIWAGIALVYGSAGWALLRSDVFKLPVHVAWKTGLSLALLGVLILARADLLPQMRQALEANRLKDANRHYRLLRLLLALALALSLATLLLGVSGAVLVR